MMSRDEASQKDLQKNDLQQHSLPLAVPLQSELPAHFQALVDHWADLPSAVRAAVRAVIEAALPGEGKKPSPGANNRAWATWLTWDRTARWADGRIVVGRAGREAPSTPAYLGWDPDETLDGWDIHRQVFAPLTPMKIAL
jgi:hypothetical protein